MKPEDITIEMVTEFLEEERKKNAIQWSERDKQLYVEECTPNPDKLVTDPEELKRLFSLND